MLGMCVTIAKDVGAMDSLNDNRIDPSSLTVLRSAQPVGLAGVLCIGHTAPLPWAHSHSSTEEIHSAIAGPATIRN